MHRHGGDIPSLLSVLLRVSPPHDRVTLRRELRAQRRTLAPASRIAAAESLANHLLALSFFPTSGYVAGYWANDGEIGLHAFQLQLPKSLIYCLPLLHADGSLRFAPWRAGDPLVTNRYGIPEPDVQPSSTLPPQAMALVVTPLVGFDAACNRLGMGGGWYDRSFAFRRSQPAPPWLVGAGFAAQQVAALHSEDWDIRLDAACCETATFYAGGTP